MADVNVVFPKDPTDLLIDAMGTTVTPQTIFQYAANMAGQYWIEPTPNFDYMANNTDELGLTFYASFGTVKEFIFTDSQGQNQYTVSALWVGGRPPVIRQKPQ